MKNEQVKLTPAFSRLEEKVLKLIEEKKSIRSIDIAKVIFANSKRKPKSISNSVTSAVRQINRKYEKAGLSTRIVGTGGGRGGKLLFLSK